METKNSVHLDNLRHSCAHLLAKSVKDLWPGTHNAIGPAIENGFYQDFDFGEVKISETDLPRIETKMKEVLKDWVHFEYKEVSPSEAKKLFAENPYKLELIREFSQEGKKLLTNNPGNFLDLCKMTHVENPAKEMQHFKLLKIAGAYWRGSEKNKMLTRIYGTAFPTKEELDKYLWQQEEAQKRDHKKLARELDLIVFSDLVGAGLPLYTPKGAVLRSAVYNYSRELNAKIGYLETALPNINRAELFRISGHYDKYKDDMFNVHSHYSEEEFFLKPMNCPQHCVLYNSRPRSYRDLPIRYADFSVLYRDERPGEINGVLRSRAFAQDDGHCFCREDQIESEFTNVLKIISEALDTYGFKYWIRLSLHDPKKFEKYLGTPEIWKDAEIKLHSVVEKANVKYKEVLGEAAIYGPKLDFMAVDSLAREWQISTIQLDLNMPGRFGLVYADNDGLEKTPIMIHRAIIGSERFIGILIEHFAGAFPVWLSPVQVKIIPVSDKVIDYARTVYQQLQDVALRVELDDRNEKLGAKIRDAQIQKIPYMVIVGQKELDGGKIAIRLRDGKDLGQIDINEFVVKVRDITSAKSLNLW